MHARLRGPKSLLSLYQIMNRFDFPSLSDEIAETFTVNEKSINTLKAILSSLHTGYFLCFLYPATL